MNPRVSHVIPNSDFTLTLTFTNGEIRRFDAKPYLDKGIFQELRDLQIFNRVKPFLGSVQWSGGQDFDPDSLYEDGVPVNPSEISDKLNELNEPISDDFQPSALVVENPTNKIR